MQTNSWDIIIQAVSLLASMASLALAIVAIWLSFKFYNMSVHSSERIEEANRAISASVDKLEKVFQMQYSDTFSMVRDTYSDFRKRLLADNVASSQSELTAENKADEKVEQLRAEIRSELNRVVDRIGKTDSELVSVRDQIEQMVDKVIVSSREIEKEAAEETAKETIAAYLKNSSKNKEQFGSLMEQFRNEIRPSDIAIALYELNREGVIKFDAIINQWHEVDINTTFTILKK